MEFIRVVLIDLPCTIRALTTYVTDDGEPFYTIFVNSKLSAEMQKRAYDHELEHINNCDFDSMSNASIIEEERHAYKAL